MKKKKELIYWGFLAGLGKKKAFALFLALLTITIVLYVGCAHIVKHYDKLPDKLAETMSILSFFPPTITAIVTILFGARALFFVGLKPSCCSEQILEINAENIASSIWERYEIVQKEQDVLLARTKYKNYNVYICRIPKCKKRNIYKQIMYYKRQVVQIENKQFDVGFIAIVDAPHHFSIKQFVKKQVFESLNCDIVCFNYPNLKQLHCYCYYEPAHCEQVLNQLIGTLQ